MIETLLWAAVLIALVLLGRGVVWWVDRYLRKHGRTP